MKKIKVSKGFKTKLSGMPDMSVIHMLEPETVALSAMDIPYIRPKLLVRENDPVKTGTPLFCDKRDQTIQYVSPGSGIVKKIVFGQRRKLHEVVISLDKKEEFIQFETLEGLKTVDSISKSKIIKLLKQGGLWQCLRQFPSRDTADENHEPAMIIVSLNGNDIFSPHPGIVLENQEQALKLGLKVLKLFSDRIVVTSRQDSLERLSRFQNLITHVVPDFYPAWDPAVVLYHLKKTAKENLSWCISIQHLLLIAQFLTTGRYPFRRIVTITRADDKKPHIITRQGAPIEDLAGKTDDESIVTTGIFNGRAADPSTHIGFFENTLNILDSNAKEKMFGFIHPGIKTATASKTFLSCLSEKPKHLDCNIHGEERACINCSYCTTICPVHLAPSFIMKSLLGDDIEDALSYGLLDCCRCGLCSYVCPSKIDLTQILALGMNAHFKDKEQA